MTGTKKFAWIFLSAFSAACASAPPPPPPKPVEPVVKVQKHTDPIEEGNARFSSGDYESALRSYDSALAQDAANEAAQFNRAVTLQALGRNDEATQAYDALLKTNPEHTDAVLNYGALLRNAGKIDQAISLYTKYLKKDKYNSKLLNNLVVLYRAKKDYKDAINAVRTLLMRDQKNIDAYKNLALVYYDQGKYKLAQTILGNALRMAKDAKLKDPDIQVNLGLTHLALGDKGLAMSAFKEAAAMDPRHALANYNIGALALAHRDYDLAKKSFEVVLAAQPADYEVNAAYGYSLQGLQLYPEAAAQLEKTRKIKDGDEGVLYQLMVIWQAANLPDKALAAADEYMQMKNLRCGPEDFDGVCGRVNGIRMMKQMADQPPPAEEEKPKATGKIELFQEGEEVPAEEGATPPAEGAQPGAQPPAEGSDAPVPDGQTR